MHITYWHETLKERGHLETPELKWKDNIKVDFKDVGCVDWTHLVQDWDLWRIVVNTVMKLRVP
jgi:hypothetical protein